MKTQVHKKRLVQEMFTAAIFTMPQTGNGPNIKKTGKKKLNCHIFAQWNTAQGQK